MKLIALLLLFGVLSLSNARIALQKRSTIYLPYEYDLGGIGTTALSESSAEQVSYDADSEIAYVVGGSVLTAVDLSNPDTPSILTFLQFENAELTDVECCGDHIFVTVRDTSCKFNGLVKIISKYNQTSGDIVELYNVPVGSGPEMVLPTSDCRKVVVAVEGEAFEEAGALVDPPGLLVIINIPLGDGVPMEQISLGFAAFDSQVIVDELSESGVRHVRQDSGTLFSLDVEPEYLSFGENEETVFVTLQENNGIATANITDGEEGIVSIDGLGFRNFSLSTMDPSDRDGGAFLNSYQVLGIPQPDGTKFFNWQGQDYLFLANEGDVKDYSDFGDDFFTEEVRGDEIDPSILPLDLDATTEAQLQQDELLGRLMFSTSPAGKDSSTGRLKALYTFGGRGYSIIRVSDMSLVYDSADEISQITEYFRKPLFNAHLDDENNKPFQDFDSRSDNKGPETEAIEVTELDGKLVTFVGNERPGTIFVYSSEQATPEQVLQDVYDSVRDPFGETWQGLYDEESLSEIDPEDIKFLSATKSPTGNPALLVTGGVTGTLSVLDVITDAPGDSLEDVQNCALQKPPSCGTW